MVRNVVSLVLVGVTAVVLGAGDVPARAGGTAPHRTGVVGGDLVPDSRFPWMVRLSMGCGGALTAPRVVLTAGHCVTGSGPDDSIGVTAGVTDLGSAAAITARSVRVIRAPGFRDETRGDDWAVIQLDHPIERPTLPLTRGPAGDAGPFTIMGWGQISEVSLRQQTKLRYASVPIVPDRACAAEYKKAGVQLVADEQICAGGHGADTCQGDSGGPMVRRNRSGDWAQVGIVSWGLGCARAGFPGVYSQVSTFRTAIRSATRKLTPARSVWAR
jgi:secreted trypsin-like serine protease